MLFFCEKILEPREPSVPDGLELDQFFFVDTSKQVIKDMFGVKLDKDPPSKNGISIYIDGTDLYYIYPIKVTLNINKVVKHYALWKSCALDLDYEPSFKECLKRGWFVKNGKIIRKSIGMELFSKEYVEMVADESEPSWERIEIYDDTWVIKDDK